MGLLVFIIVGAIAGFAAGKATGKGMAVLWELLVGILGGCLAGLVGISASTGPSTLGGVLSAFVAAAFLLIVFRLVTGPGSLPTASALPERIGLLRRSTAP